MRALLCSLILLTAAMPAKADSISELFKNSGEGCLETVKVNLGDAIRNGIDSEVQRREQALKMPASLSGLSCLDSLMNLDLDLAIQVPSLTSVFSSALSDAANQVCKAAQQEIAKLTESLKDAIQIPSLSSLGLSGTGASGGPNVDYSTGNTSITTSGASVQSSQARDGAGSIMNELYRNLYGTGQ